MTSHITCGQVPYYVLMVAIFLWFTEPTETCRILLTGWTPISIGERTRLAEYVITGYVERTFKDQRTSADTYSAEIYVIEILKGSDVTNGISTATGTRHNISNFGNSVDCYADIDTEQTYIFFLTMFRGSLSAKYDDIFGAVSEHTKGNENEVTEALGKFR